MSFNLLITDMARTRGTFVPHGGPSSLHAKAFEQEPRRRPTTSTCRRGKGRHGYSGPSAYGEAGSSTGHGEAAPSSTTPADIHEERENVIQHVEVVAEKDHNGLDDFLEDPRILLY